MGGTALIAAPYSMRLCGGRGGGRSVFGCVGVGVDCGGVV